MTSFMFVVIVYMPHERRRWELILTLNLDLIFVCPEAFLNLRKKNFPATFYDSPLFLSFSSTCMLCCWPGHCEKKKDFRSTYNTTF